MKNSLLIAVALLFAVSVSGQSLIRKTVYKSDSVDLGAGSTVSVTGAPSGSVAVEGWTKNEVEISAEIVIEAPSEADLARIGEVSGFVFDQEFNSLRIRSVGAFDKDYLKRVAKNFPKKLVGLPLTINYLIKVPRFCDLNISGGKGALKLKDVDGSLVVNFLDVEADITLPGGALQATFGTGKVVISVPTRNWRGRFVDVSLTTGAMSVRLPAGLNAEVDASILRTGAIENTFAELKPREKRVPFTPTSVAGKAGNGGVGIKFTVGDGTLAISGN